MTLEQLAHLTQTTEQTTYKPRLDRPPVWPALIALLGELTKLLPKEKHSKPHASKFELWRADSLLRRISANGLSSILNQKDHEQSAVHHDALNVAKEYLLAELETSFSYTLNSKNELLSGGYSDDLSFMANHHLKLLSRDGKTLTRASLETQITHLVRNWARATASTPGKYLIWTSSPGSKENGYHGSTCLDKNNWSAKEKNHSFFYLMWAEPNVDEDTITVNVRQLRAWPNINQLIDIQKKLGSRAPTLDPNNPMLGLIENLIETNELNLIPEEAVKKIQQVLYEKTEGWFIKPNELPEVNTEEFWALQKKLFAEFYLKQAVPLFKQVPQNLAENDPYWASPECKLLIDQLDLIFTYYHGALEKWLHTHNTNPDYNPIQLNWHTVKEVLKHPSKIWLSLKEKLNLQTTQKTKLEDVEDLYKIDRDVTVFKKKPSAEDMSFYTSKVGSTVSVLGSVYSIGSCGILAPFTMPISLMRLPVGAESLSVFQASLSVLNLPQKQALLDHLNSQDYIELDLRSQGAAAVYMVPKSYLEEKGCTADPATGRVWGPCEGPRGRIYLDDEQDTLSFQMTKEQFDEYLATLQSEVTNSTVDELQKAVNTLPEADKPRAQELLQTIINKVIKPVASITELLNNDLLNPTYHNQLLLDLVEKIKNTPNPIKHLQAALEKVEQPELFLATP